MSKSERQKECELLRLEELEGNMRLLQTFEIECIPLTVLLFQMGYLTIKDYDPITEFYQLKYPNYEVKRSLHIHLLAALSKQSLTYVNSIMSSLFKSLLKEDLKQVMECLASVFNNIPYQLHIMEKEIASKERILSRYRSVSFYSVGN